MTFRRAAAFVMFVATTFPGTSVLAAGDAVEGKRIAKQWCSSCHLVDEGTRSGDAAPPFIALANDPAKTETYLKNWIRNPHPPMPNFNLSRRDIDDLTTYIGTLSSKKGGRAVPHN